LDDASELFTDTLYVMRNHFVAESRCQKLAATQALNSAKQSKYSTAVLRFNPLRGILAACFSAFQTAL
jgi:hypothetical protein